MKDYRLFLLFLSLFSCVVYSATPAYLLSVKIEPSATETRFIFILNKKVKAQVKYIQNKNELVLLIENTIKRFTIKNLNLKSANVISIQEDPLAKNNVRYIFKVTSPIKWSLSTVNDKAKVMLRLNIVSLDNKVHAQVKRMSEKFRKDLLRTLVQLKPPKKIPANPKPCLIVIDPGHGGKDPGALGSRGVKEKEVVFAIAKQLATVLNQKPGVQAVLTRDDDRYVSLRKRLQVARNKNANLFISIHADAYFDNGATGASVYAVSQRGATTEAARWLAQRENYSELDGVELDALQDRSPVLRSVLIDLAQTVTIRDSVILGNKILDALDNVSTLHYRHVEQAPFVVLKSPDIPSILIEVGFISNRHEEKRLSNALYQKKLALAIKQGIEKYISR